MPDVFSPETLVGEVQERIKKKEYSTFPITEDGVSNGKLVGYITQKDFDPQLHSDLKLEERMIPKERVIAQIEHEETDFIPFVLQFEEERHSSVENGVLESVNSCYGTAWRDKLDNNIIEIPTAKFGKKFESREKYSTDMSKFFVNNNHSIYKFIYNVVIFIPEIFFQNNYDINSTISF